MSGAVALVTGAGQGIGEAVARTLARAGTSVVVTDRDGDKAAAVAAALGEGGALGPALDATDRDAGKTAVVAAGLSAGALSAALDVTDAAAVEALVAWIEDEVGPLATLVNVAGVLRTGPALDCDPADWDALFAVNATGVFTVSRAVARRMVARGGGSIVTVASNAAGIPRVGMAAYGASKAAAALFTKSLGLELAPHGIRCNVVAPGSTDTPMLRSLWNGSDGAAATIAGDPGAFKVGIPLGRLAAAQDVADAVAFLVSDRARHITMQEIYVDGGATLR